MSFRLNTGSTGSVVTAKADGSLYSNIFGNGNYVLASGDQLAAAVSGTSISFGTGDVIMNGRHGYISYDDTDSVELTEGTSGYYRYDLICVHYFKTDSGAESMELAVIEGTPATSSPSVPSYTSGDISEGDSESYFPLYQAYFSGTSITLTTLFSTVDPLATISGRAPYYGTCTVSASTKEKTVTVDDSFQLVNGARVAVTFGSENTATNATLNVNNTGAMMIFVDGLSIIDINTWNAGETVDFVYVNGGWNMIRPRRANSSANGTVTLSDSYTSSGGAASSGVAASSKAVYDAYTAAMSAADTAQETADTAQETADAANERAPYYGTCTVSAITQEKTVTVDDSFQLVEGARVAVFFNNKNTASGATLNVNGTGAKKIYIGNAVVNDTNTWSEAETVDFVYGGTYWYAIRPRRATSSYNGTVTLSDSIKSTSSVNSGVATTPYAVNSVRKTIRNYATYVVAASDSVGYDYADYQCDGTDDDEDIQSAIDALSDNGGKIILLEGTYNISTALTCGKDVVFEGMGDSTILNVTSTQFICLTAKQNTVFRDMYITAEQIEDGLINCYVEYKINLLLDNVKFDVSGANHGLIVAGYGSGSTAVTLHKITANVYSNTANDCSSVFYRCFIKGGDGCYIDLDYSESGYSAEIFYICSGCFSNGRLISECYITGIAEQMSIDSSYISAKSLSGGSISGDCYSRITNNKIIISNSGYYINAAIISGNQILKNTSYTATLNGYVVSGNVIQNLSSGDISFRAYSIVTGNVSKYTMASSTPTGTTIANNVVSTSVYVPSGEV